MPNNPNFLPIPRTESYLQRVGMVESLVLRDGKWNLALLQSLFHQDIVGNILDIFWCNSEEGDKLVWLPEKSSKGKICVSFDLSFG